MKIKHLSALLASSVLAGCFSGGPSESEAREAMRPMLTSNYYLCTEDLTIC